MKILGTGLNGLVGSRVVDLLKDEFQFENISRSTGVDITNSEQVSQAISKSDAEIILHMAAKANVDGCEEDRKFGKDGQAWKINVEGTKNIAEAAEKSNKKLIYISTDFVFDGENPRDGGYTEEDGPNPINWYGQTKLEGENVVQAISTPWIIMRISYPYRAAFEKNDFMRAMKGRLEQGQEVKAVTDHVFCPTFIDDIAKALDVLIKKNAKGIFHVVGSQALSPYDAAGLITKEFNYDHTLISKTTREEYFAGKADRPFRLQLKNDKITRLGMKLKSFEEGLVEIKHQLQ